MAACKMQRLRKILYIAIGKAGPTKDLVIINSGR